VSWARFLVPYKLRTSSNRYALMRHRRTYPTSGQILNLEPAATLTLQQHTVCVSVSPHDGNITRKVTYARGSPSWSPYDAMLPSLPRRRLYRRDKETVSPRTYRGRPNPKPVPGGGCSAEPERLGVHSDRTEVRSARAAPSANPTLGPTESPHWDQRNHP
jgi:hypothetical protein